jgi:hypothetical protein
VTLALLVADDPAVTAGDRRTRMLRTAMGPAIAAALEDPGGRDSLNPDGSRSSAASALDATFGHFPVGV